MPKRTGVKEGLVLEAMRLRLAGATYRQIAASQWCSRQEAYRRVQRAIREYAAEPATTVRDLEVARLDALLMGHWQPAVAGDPRHTQIVLQIMERRARLLGLDAPARINLTAQIRDLAIREGLDPDQAVRDAEAIVRGVQW